MSFKRKKLTQSTLHAFPLGLRTLWWT